MKIPAGKQLIDVIKLAYEAKRPVLLEGPPGVGKSEIMIEAARILGIDCIVRDLSLMEAPDLAGLPIIDKATNTMTFAIPKFLPRAGSGLLVIEELKNRAGQHVIAPCLQLLTARCLNDYNLPPGWLPVAAINPSSLDGIVADDLDAALRSRFCVVEVEADVKEWLAWAESHGVHHAVLSFIRDSPNIFIAPQVDPDSNTTPVPLSNPRSWTYGSDIIYAAERTNASTQSLVIAMSGLVGPELAAACLAYRDQGGNAVPEAASIIASFASHRQKVERMVSVGNTAFVSVLVHKLLIYLQDPQQAARVMDHRRQSANVRALIKILPAEFRAKIIENHSWAVKENP